jgi:hypothetical protein
VSVLVLDASEGETYGMLSTLRLSAAVGDGVLPTDLLPLRDFLEGIPARVVTSGLLVTSVLHVTVNSSAELMGTSESCSVGIANRPDELALPKVAVLFEDIFTTER